ncbi:MAG: hypothetical protein ACR5KV_07720 [Wolbachia sp.]
MVETQRQVLVAERGVNAINYKNCMIDNVHHRATIVLMIYRNLSKMVVGFVNFDFFRAISIV